MKGQSCCNSKFSFCHQNQNSKPNAVGLNDSDLFMCLGYWINCLWQLCWQPWSYMIRNVYDARNTTVMNVLKTRCHFYSLTKHNSQCAKFCNTLLHRLICDCSVVLGSEFIKEKIMLTYNVGFGLPSFFAFWNKCSKDFRKIWRWIPSPKSIRFIVVYLTYAVSYHHLLLLLPLALQPTVGFGLSNSVLPFFPICYQLSPSSHSQHLKISFYFLFSSFPRSSLLLVLYSSCVKIFLGILYAVSISAS